MTELYDITHYYKTSLGMPLTIKKSEGVVIVNAFNQIVGVGEYKLTIALSILNKAAKQAEFGVTGDIVTPWFIHKGKENLDLTPWTYIVPFTQIAPVALNFWLSARANDGSGDPEIEIMEAYLMLERVEL